MVKKLLNAFFMKTLSYRVVHSQLVVDSDMEVWKSLKERGFRPRTIIDVGAAVGSWTSQVIEIFPESKYLIVDPLKENEQALKAVVQRHANVQYWLGAVGSQAGELTFHVHGDQSSMFDSDWGRKGTLRRVPMRTLDSVANDMNCHDVEGLKLDVQGAEIEVLKGATEVLRQCQVAQVEVSFGRFTSELRSPMKSLRSFLTGTSEFLISPRCINEKTEHSSKPICFLLEMTSCLSQKHGVESRHVADVSSLSTRVLQK
jgi:FkbM family methyltransferase